MPSYFDRKSQFYKKFQSGYTATGNSQHFRSFQTIIPNNCNLEKEWFDMFSSLQIHSSIKIKFQMQKHFAQRGARTHDPEIKSLMLYRLS